MQYIRCNKKGNLMRGEIMLMGKKRLLACAKNTAEYINSIGGGNFAGFIVDIIRFANKQYVDNEQKVGKLWEILFNVKNTNIEIIGGGNSIKEAYIKFVDEFLRIKKAQNAYKPQNPDFDKLTHEEIYYIFAWVRRLLTKEKSKLETQRHEIIYKDTSEYGEQDKNNNKKSNQNRNKDQKPFNSSMAEQLEKLSNNKKLDYQ